MRELDGRRLPSRIRGRQALERSLRLLLIRAHRYGEHRAGSAADRLWAGAVIDRLRALLHDDAPAAGSWRSRSQWESGDRQ